MTLQSPVIAQSIKWTLRSKHLFETCLMLVVAIMRPSIPVRRLPVSWLPVVWFPAGLHQWRPSNEVECCFRFEWNPWKVLLRSRNITKRMHKPKMVKSCPLASWMATARVQSFVKIEAPKYISNRKKVKSIKVCHPVRNRPEILRLFNHFLINRFYKYLRRLDLPVSVPHTWRHKFENRPHFFYMPLPLEDLDYHSSPQLPVSCSSKQHLSYFYLKIISPQTKW